MRQFITEKKNYSYNDQYYGYDFPIENEDSLIQIELFLP